MAEIVEALGSMAEGALLARAVEPTAGEADGHTHESACLNCGTPLVGPHCHQCGQRGHVHRTIGAFFHDLLHGVLHFEGKLWRTLPLLAWRPGKLTREYIDGRRASYVSPIALFLFTIFVTFALWNALAAGQTEGQEAGLAEGGSAGELAAGKEAEPVLLKNRGGRDGADSGPLGPNAPPGQLPGTGGVLVVPTNPNAITSRIQDTTFRGRRNTSSMPTSA